MPVRFPVGPYKHTNDYLSYERVRIGLQGRDGQMDGRRAGLIEGRTEGGADAGTDGQMDGWTDGKGMCEGMTHSRNLLFSLSSVMFITLPHDVAFLLHIVLRSASYVTMQ